LTKFRNDRTAKDEQENNDAQTRYPNTAQHRPRLCGRVREEAQSCNGG
jgi:hypothetical protein